MKKAAFVSAVSALALVLVVAGCRAGSPSPAGAPSAAGARNGAPTGGQGAGAQAATGRRAAAISVQAAAVQSGPLVTDNETAGTVVAVMQSQVAAQVSGVVRKVLYKPGDWIKQGAVVIQLDDSALKLATQNAQAALDSARINLAIGQQSTTESRPRLTEQLQSAQNAFSSAQKTYDSQKALYDQGGATASAIDTARSQLEQAQANVEAAQLALDQNSAADTQGIAQLKLAVIQAENQLALSQLSLQNAAIKAPFAGQIASISASPGMYVNLNSAAFLLMSAEKQVNFTEPPTDAPSFRIGDTVLFNVGGTSHPVKVVQTPAAPINGVVPMVASLPAGLPLAYGTVGTVTYRLTIATGAQIPIAALQNRASTNFVYTVVNGKATEAPVVVIAEAGTTAVVSGVKAGDQVIINPPPGLLAGSTVQVVAASSAPGQPQSQAGAAPQSTGGAK